MTFHKPKIISANDNGPRPVTTRQRLTYANVVSTLALFLALGGVSYAAAAWTGADIIDGTLTGADVQDNTLHQADLGRDSVAFDELAYNSVIGLHVQDGSLTGTDVENHTIGNADIGTAAIGAEHLSVNSVGTAAIALNGVGSSEIATDAVGYDELAANTVRTGHILDGQVSSADIANGGLLSQDAASSFKAPDADSVDGVDSSRMLRDYERVTSNGATLAAREAGSLEAICPAGKRAIGGGYYTLAPQFRVTGSYPTEAGDRWRIDVKNDSYTVTGFFQAMAVCVRAA